MNALVLCLIHDGSGNIYAGGNFTKPGNYIAKWNGHAWSSVGYGMEPNQVGIAVEALTFDHYGTLYAGGR